MNISAVRVFRVLLVSSTLLGFLAGIYPYLGLHATSENLELILAWSGYSGLLFSHGIDEATWLEIVFFVIIILSLIAYFVGTVGAFFLKRWGRFLLVASSVFFIVITPFFGLQILLPAEYFLSSISAAAFYAALTMSFLPPLSGKFIARTDKNNVTF